MSDLSTGKTDVLMQKTTKITVDNKDEMSICCHRSGSSY